MLPQEKTQNRLLSSMRENDFALLRPMLTATALPLRKVLQTRGRKIEHVYFLEEGLASIVASAGSERRIEVGVIGREGVTGLALIMGVETSPYDAFMQSAGFGWSLTRPQLQGALMTNPRIRDHLLLYGHTLVLQMAFTVLANGKYTVSERLARWLLMAHDRGNPGPVHLTHEFLAMMLGVRRPGVTTALKVMEDAGLVTTARGAITIVNRSALEEASNGCYGVPEAEFERLFVAAPPATAMAS